MGVIQLATWQLDDDDDDSQQQTQGQGKDPVRAQLKALEKANKELLEKLNAAQATARTSSLKDILTEKKLPAKLAKLIPSDIEATPEAIDAWVKDYEDIFGTTQKTTEETPEQQAPDGQTQQTSGEQQDEAYVKMMNAFNRMNQTSTNAKAPDNKPDELMRLINSPDLKQEDLLKLIEASGGGYGSG